MRELAETPFQRVAEPGPKPAQFWATVKRPTNNASPQTCWSGNMDKTHFYVVDSQRLEVVAGWVDPVEG